ncbi:hypothetical protein MKW98_018975 [Papaver atlanticum]|uniref:Cytochrome P450 n=1 Tax=Papaver atlanticum TaxID=357466 RepID=A0AAD4XXY4_9MAGN|nr:hypothetical protein MKW98_018975 [Papaver atlanticum]
MERANNLSIFFSSSNFNEYKIDCSIFLMSIVLTYVFMHRWNQRNLNSPKSWPFIGVLIELLMNYHRMHDWLTEYFVESKTFKPANVEHVLKTNIHNYPKGEAFHACMEELFGDGIFNSDGEIWKQQRKTSSFEFASRNLRNFSTIVFRDYALILSGILHQASICGKEIDMQELLLRMTLDSICKVGFGVEIGTLAHELPDNRFAKACEDATSTITYRFINPLWRLEKFFNVGSEALLVQSIQVIDEFTYSLIHKRKAELQGAKTTDNNAKHDIMSRFIELSENADNSLTDRSLRDVIINFVLATIYKELLTFEENQANEVTVYDPEEPKSFTERLAIFASLLNYDSLGRLSYLHATITETLLAGGQVVYSSYAMGRMVYNWGPYATSFNPDGWLNKEGLCQSASPFKFTAFQAGPRTCLGKDSAYLQMKMTLAILCRFFNFHLIPYHPVEYKMTTTLNMKHGLKLTITTRQS